MAITCVATSLLGFKFGDVVPEREAAGLHARYPRFFREPTPAESERIAALHPKPVPENTPVAAPAPVAEPVPPVPAPAPVAPLQDESHAGVPQ